MHVRKRKSTWEDFAQSSIGGPTVRVEDGHHQGVDHDALNVWRLSLERTPCPQGLLQQEMRASSASLIGCLGKLLYFGLRCPFLICI